MVKLSDNDTFKIYQWRYGTSTVPAHLVNSIITPTEAAL
jgi:hypothetical protein